MNTVLLDACFMIGLRDVGRLALLGQVAELLNWSLFIPDPHRRYPAGRRSTIETDMDLLKMCQEPTTITKITNEQAMNATQAQLRLAFLQEQGALVAKKIMYGNIKTNKTAYITTEKGQKIIAAYQDFLQLYNNTGVDL